MQLEVHQIPSMWILVIVHVGGMPHVPIAQAIFTHVMSTRTITNLVGMQPLINQTIGHFQLYLYENVTPRHTWMHQLTKLM